MEAIEVKAITTINAEFITSMERKYAKELHTITLAQECKSMLAAYSANPKLKHKILVDHSKPSMEQPTKMSGGCEGQAPPFYTVAQVNAWIDTEKLNLRMKQIKNFVTSYYGPCTSAISKFSENGRMTKYWWDVESCKTEATPGDAGTSCTSDQVAKIEVDASNVRKVTCEDPVAPADGETPSNILSMDLLIATYCLPQFDNVASDLCKPTATP